VTTVGVVAGTANARVTSSGAECSMTRYNQGPGWPRGACGPRTRPLRRRSCSADPLQLPRCSGSTNLRSVSTEHKINSLCVCVCVCVLCVSVRKMVEFVFAAKAEAMASPVPVHLLVPLQARSPVSVHTHSNMLIMHLRRGPQRHGDLGVGTERTRRALRRGAGPHPSGRSTRCTAQPRMSSAERISAVKEESTCGETI
jgi:hypothetical protein